MGQQFLLDMVLSLESLPWHYFFFATAVKSNFLEIAEQDLSRATEFDTLRGFFFIQGYFVRVNWVLFILLYYLLEFNHDSRILDDANS